MSGTATSAPDRAGEAALRRAVVIGASRGIGKALAESLAGQGAHVTATVRSEPAPRFAAGSGRVETTLLDLDREDAGEDIVARLGSGELDALVVNAGIFGPDHQDAAQASPEEVSRLFWTNAVGPVRVARRLLSRLRPGGVIAFLSSRTASIALNEEGDMELYRASKAALNALARSFAIKDALPAHVGVLLLHPGWVQTDMGGDKAPVTIDDSVRGLRHVLVGALDRPAIRFVDYQGHSLSW